MPVAPVTAFERRGDRCLQLGVRVRGLRTSLMVEVRRPGQLGDIEEHLESVFGLESTNGIGFHRCCCALKARNFPR